LPIPCYKSCAPGHAYAYTSLCNSTMRTDHRGSYPRAPDVFAAAGSLYQIVQMCPIFGSWPAWGDEVLLQWLLRQTPNIRFAEVQVISEESKFLDDHTAGSRVPFFLSLYLSHCVTVFVAANVVKSVVDEENRPGLWELKRLPAA
jgi:hypothetical protein